MGLHEPVHPVRAQQHSRIGGALRVQQFGHPEAKGGQREVGVEDQMGQQREGRTKQLDGVLPPR